VTGLPAVHWVGRPFSSLLVGEAPEEAWSRLQSAPGPAFEVRVRAAGGERVLEVVVAMATDLSGDLLGIGRDVSERKEAENRRAALETQLRQSQKREAIGTLASGIAHDFNNVLTAIMGHAQLLHDETHGTLQARAGEILQASARARDVVRQLLTFARSSGHEHRPVRLQQVLTEALQLMRASLPASVVLDSSIDSGTAMVLADQGQMHQVVINLVTNAAAALQGRTGKVGVYLGNLPPSGEGSGSPGTVRLRVTDDGMGMAPEVLERIFEPFFTTRALGEGTGLGLAVVQGIVQDHGGQIFVRSAPGKGTTFDVELPAAGVERLDQPAGPPVAQRGSGERLLVVDDEPVIARVVGEQLRRLGYHVTSVNDPEEALELLAEEPEEFDLLLTDLQMPRMDGVELAARVGRLRPELPVVLSTGNRWSVPVSTARAAGIREIVDKPFRLEELAHALRTVLEAAGVRPRTARDTGS
jgi:signal transduction histidine kinase/CheY-like chemotaxis protein